MKSGILSLRFLLFVCALVNVSLAIVPGPLPGARPKHRSAESGEEFLTNAQRFQRGLPPRAPRTLFNPSAPALAPRISPVAQCQLDNYAPKGNIAVYNGDTFYSWLRDGNNLLSISPIAYSKRSKGNVFTYTDTGSGLQFKWCSSDSVSPRYLSFIRSSIQYLQTGYTYYQNLFWSTLSVPAGTSSVYDGSYYVQNADFYIDSVTNEITAIFVNPDGSPAPSTVPILFYASSSQLWGTASLDAGVSEFKLYWVPI
ncbi:hypothetical protein GYMLUDRAFT_82114 [Collybiopsis luxurians FD-317 M1]|nr:hypothetical protein GYMLUDRAFT_82114 [Collybiopsis luxurians FD-317 M1]